MPEPQVKLIKRYANRRLYDAESSKVITLDDVARSIREGNEVRVVDSVSGEDLTVRVLGQTFLKSLEQNQEYLEFTTFLLTVLIREFSSDLSHLFSNLVQGGFGLASLSKDRLEKIAQDLVNQGELSIGEKKGYVEELVQQVRDGMEDMGRRTEEGLGLIRQQLLSAGHQKMEDLSSKLEELAEMVRDMKKE